MPQLRNKSIFAAIVMIAFLSGCSSTAHERDLPGTFQLRADWGCATLILRADHTFHQEALTGCAGKPVLADGKWTVESQGDSVFQISLLPFLSIEGGKIKLFGMGYLAIQKLAWSPVRLVVDPDAGINYQKEK